MNTGAPWPSLDEAEARVLAMQTKLHHWAKVDPGRRFDDVFNLVYDPAFLTVAWRRVRGNKGARTAGIGPPVRPATGAGEDDSQGRRQGPRIGHSHGHRKLHIVPTSRRGGLRSPTRFIHSGGSGFRS